MEDPHLKSSFAELKETNWPVLLDFTEAETEELGYHRAMLFGHELPTFFTPLVQHRYDFTPVAWLAFFLSLKSFIGSSQRRAE